MFIHSLIQQIFIEVLFVPSTALNAGDIAVNELMLNEEKSEGMHAA